MRWPLLEITGCSLLVRNVYEMWNVFLKAALLLRSLNTEVKKKSQFWTKSVAYPFWSCPCTERQGISLSRPAVSSSAVFCGAQCGPPLSHGCYLLLFLCCVLEHDSSLWNSGAEVVESESWCSLGLWLAAVSGRELRQVPGILRLSFSWIHSLDVAAGRRRSSHFPKSSILG